MAVGDGSIVRAGLDAVLDLLHKFAAPTGERGSILLMSGGLIVLGFLFLAFLFRSAIVGDLAPVANARLAAPRAHLPPPLGAASAITTRAVPAQPFNAGREIGREVGLQIDGAFSKLAKAGMDARILRSNMHWKLVRLYACSSCAEGENARGCELERGLLAGAFESMSGDLAKVHETACVARGDPHCEFEIRHAPLVEVVA